MRTSDSTIQKPYPHDSAEFENLVQFTKTTNRNKKIQKNLLLQSFVFQTCYIAVPFLFPLYKGSLQPASAYCFVGARRMPPEMRIPKGRHTDGHRVRM